MELREIETTDIERVAGWLSREENYRWLDFGAGRRAIDAVTLRVMLQRDLHLLRGFTPDGGGGELIGVVGLSDIDREFRTATLWFVLGEKGYGRRGYTTRAASRLLTLGFRDLGLGAVSAWTVECNTGSRRVLERLNFRLVGRQRRCHYLDGRPFDRLWFDLLAGEHEEMRDGRRG